MKVISVEVDHVVVPLAKPIGFALGSINSLGCLLITVRSDNDVFGENLVFTLNDARSRVLAEMIASLEPLIVGSDPSFTADFWSRAWRAINFIGHTGVSIVGISAIDGALWDLNAKAAGMPVHRMLGSAKSRVPAYHSGGLWLTASISDLEDEAAAMVAAGFTAVKVRLGAPTAEADVARVRAVRAAIGPDVRLLADANQALDEGEAIRRGHLLERFDLTWFEEPLPAWNLEGLARVKSALPMPIASGENEYTRYGFRRMIERNAADVLMPDLQRVGGVTEFVRVGHLAEAFDLSVSSHLFPETSIQVLAALRNSTFLEYLPWFSDFYCERLTFEDGDAIVPDQPGWGFTFNRDYIASLMRAS